MTDMRATQRLLEFIAEQRAIAADWTADPAAKDALEQIERAITELRRRGDMLVRREDLRTVLRHVDPLGDDPALAPAVGRLDVAVGGTL